MGAAASALAALAMLMTLLLTTIGALLTEGMLAAIDGARRGTGEVALALARAVAQTVSLSFTALAETLLFFDLRARDR